MKIPSGNTNTEIYFVAVDSTDRETRLTGLTSGDLAVEWSLDGSAMDAIDTLTVTDHGNGQYSFTLNEGTTLTGNKLNQELLLEISGTGMLMVSRVIEIYYPHLDILTEEDTEGALRFTSKALENGPVSGGGFITGAWRYSNNTTEADPGAGGVRLNNSDFSLVTEIYINSLTDNNSNAEPYIEALKAGDKIQVSQESDGSRFFRGVVVSVTNNTGWYKVEVTHEDSGTAIQNNQTSHVTFGYDSTVDAGAIASAVWAFDLGSGSSAQVVILGMDTQLDSMDLQLDSIEADTTAILDDLIDIYSDTQTLVTTTGNIQTEVNKIPREGNRHLYQRSSGDDDNPVVLISADPGP